MISTWVLMIAAGTYYRTSIWWTFSTGVRMAVCHISDSSTVAPFAHLKFSLRFSQSHLLLAGSLCRSSICDYDNRLTRSKTL